jgi:hypothetical protein
MWLVNDRRLNLILCNTNCDEKLSIKLFLRVPISDLKSVKKHRA